ncbi:hypothetical protein HK104_010918 [Borealophlyctis nickersoniae]|nr:hypothetical protein HK104_010918 [Borealophlyctis nickersoniae]
MATPEPQDKPQTPQESANTEVPEHEADLPAPFGQPAPIPGDPGFPPPAGSEGQEAATTLQAAYRGHQVRAALTEEAEAATKLQAAWRGYKVRKGGDEGDAEEQGEPRDGAQDQMEETDIGPGNVAEQVPDAEATGEDEAAVRLQAAWRGYKVRKDGVGRETQGGMAEESDAGAASRGHTGEGENVGSVDETVEERREQQPIETLEADAAAVKVQSLWRGHQTRKELGTHGPPDTEKCIETDASHVAGSTAATPASLGMDESEATTAARAVSRSQLESALEGETDTGIRADAGDTVAAAISDLGAELAQTTIAAAVNASDSALAATPPVAVAESEVLVIEQVQVTGEDSDEGEIIADDRPAVTTEIAATAVSSVIQTVEAPSPIGDPNATEAPPPAISPTADSTAQPPLPSLPKQVSPPPAQASPTNDTSSSAIRSRLEEWYRKKYLGGFRSRKTGVEYFHAETQTPTPQEIKAMKALPKFHRDTQTKFTRNRIAQCKRDSFTQMTKRGVHITSETDVRMYPHRYITADQHEAWVIHNIIRIQCWVRRIYALRLVRKLRIEREERNRLMIEKERRRKELAERKRRKEIESRLHPKSRKDFEILYNGLENWRQQETEKINRAGYSEPARLAALADLLDQEAALIQKIDRLRIAANEENRDRGIVKLLDMMASPKRWPAAKGTIVHVDTPNTIRARELKDLYHALNIPLLSVDERLQILLHVKYTVKEFDCNLTREIVELIDREGDLVSRGRDAKSLEGLRKRISNLFLQFMQTPEFNPEAASYQKFPDAGQSWKRDQAVYYCRGCTSYLPSTEFYLSTTMKHLGKCKNCTTKENIATQRKDDSVYADMLRMIRIQEGHKRNQSGIPADPHYNALSLLQESDMRYLVDVVWNRQSAISSAKALETLVLTRWDPNEEISPWNCILLTKAEAATHDRQQDARKMYSEEFVRKIQQKHFAAKQHFAQLPAMERYLRKHYVEDVAGKMVYRPEMDE